MRVCIRPRDVMDIKFRQYDLHNACYQQAWELRNQVLRRPLDLSLTAKDRETDKDCRHFGLFKGKQLLATVTIQANQDGESPHSVKLRQMVVSPKHQNQGLGQQLIEKTEATLLSLSVTSIVLAARLPAVGFYQKLGYKTQGSVYHHLRIDHQDMFKTLI